jgi:acetyl esterase/lipase
MSAFYIATVLGLLILLVLALNGGPSRRPPRAVRLGLECLEARLTPSTYEVTNVRYENVNKGVMDIYSDTTYTSAPIVVLVHGGGWVEGNNLYTENEYASYFLSQGFVVVAPNYPLVTPDGSGGYTNQFPVPVDAVATAVSWIEANAAQYGANPNEVVMLGTSAGTQIAAMIAFDPTGFNNWGQPTPLHIAGFIGDSGSYDWALTNQYVYHSVIQEYLGSYYGAAQWGPTEPITFVGPGAPPALLIDGSADLFSNYQNSVEFALALQAAGDQVTYQLYANYGHTEFSQLFATDPAEQQVLTTYLQSIGL